MKIVDDFEERVNVEWWSGSMSDLRSDEEARKGKTLLWKVLDVKRWGDREDSCMKFPLPN